MSADLVLVSTHIWCAGWNHDHGHKDRSHGRQARCSGSSQRLRSSRVPCRQASHSQVQWPLVVGACSCMLKAPGGATAGPRSETRRAYRSRHLCGVRVVMTLPLPRLSLGEPSLVELLTRLGHRCPGGCGPAAEQLEARVWFSRRRESAQGRRGSAQIVVDTSGYRGGLLVGIQLLRQINECTAIDWIHVSERRWGDAGRALSTSQLSRVEPVTSSMPPR